FLQHRSQQHSSTIIRSCFIIAVILFSAYQPVFARLTENRVFIKTTAPVDVFPPHAGNRASYAGNQQGIPIRGRVTDTDGNPLTGVSIAVQGMAIGSTTDNNGAYFIHVPDSNRVLVFTSVGFASRTLPINGSTSFDVQLELSTAS